MAKIHQTILPLAMIIFLCPGIFAQQQIVPPRSYVAHKITTPLNIDGKGDEEAWKQAPETEDFIDIEGEKTPAYKTRVRMLWDEEYLYFLAEMEEPHVWGTLKQRDTVIFYNNDFEVFIDPDGDTHNYMEFEMNALNTVWDLYLVKPYRENAPVIDSWDIQGIKTAVHIDGTLNNPGDTDKGWSVEIAMPWEVLKEAHSGATESSPENEFWRINFSRVNWDYELDNGKYGRKKDRNGKYLPEYNWVWSPQWVVNMHEPEWWGYVYFSPEAPGKGGEFSIPDDEKIKWELYALYRKQKAHKQENGNWIHSVRELVGTPLVVEGKPVKISLEMHSTGWNLTALSPFTGKTLTVTEDGRFILWTGV
ncbi:carbohydrate-binding family 9-like protein [Sinomicrobium soli]|uniref:carbohydrate-binding family 9-like protein n=1 Tax=Sinomicrobium sp. N-1-3-6 TaxID=2219864 RepID=UPI000DCF15B2|nr:carbohydrate-binding family 9-like protein [Sinomicrobium sp. N-1-3-6]RAV30880.1 carbohydrate-binding family 9-like protein [Sinomicrobium sp. N-1-3-6]